MRHAFVDIADKTMCSRCGNEVFRVDEACPAAENAELREQLKKPEPEMHPLVDLFLRRAASNPEEMAAGKWRWVVDRILAHGSQADKDAVLPVYNKVMLDGAHREMMRELLNPEQPDLFTGKGPLKYDKATRTSKRTTLHQPAGKP